MVSRNEVPTNPSGHGDDGTAPRPGAAERLARWLARRKDCTRDLPPEAEPLAEACDATVVFSNNMSFAITCIVDAVEDPSRQLELNQEQLTDVGRALLKYTANISGNKLPVFIRVVEIRAGSHPERRERLKALYRTLPNRAKVGIFCYELDPTRRSAWCPGWLNGLLRGRRLYEKAMGEWDDPSLLVPDRPWGDGAAHGHTAGSTTTAGSPRTSTRWPAASRSLRNPLAAIGNHKPVATLALLAVLTACFAAELAIDLRAPGEGFRFTPGLATLQGLGGLFKPAVLEQGQWWRLLTAPMLHAGVLHLLFNSIALLLAGIVLEGVAGRAWFVGLFFIGGLGGSLASLLINPANLVSVGASGAIMALLAAGACVAQRLPPGERMSARFQLLRILIPSLLPLVSVHSGKHIDYAAHVGGALVGTMVGLLLIGVWPRTSVAPPGARLMRAIAAAGVVALLISGPLAAHSYSEVEQQLALEQLLVPNDKLPSGGDEGWLPTMASSAPAWLQRYPRDPRVHVAAAMWADKRGDLAGAERELRAALSEPKLLALLLPPGAFADAVRSDLAAIVASQGRRDEARDLAAPLCASHSGAAERMASLGLCATDL